jgi:hypothetical protein
VLPRRKVASSVDKETAQAGGDKRAPSLVQVVIDHPFDYYTVCAYGVACYLVTRFIGLDWPYFVALTGAQLVVTTLQCM